MCVSSYALLRCVPRHICSIPLCVLLWLGRYLIVLVPVREVSLSLSLSLSCVFWVAQVRLAGNARLFSWCVGGAILEACVSAPDFRSVATEGGAAWHGGVATLWLCAWLMRRCLVCLVDAEMPHCHADHLTSPDALISCGCLDANLCFAARRIDGSPHFACGD